MIESNSLKTMLININGLSNHSKAAVESYIDEQGVGVLALCETGKLLGQNDFRNYITYSKNQRKGVSISIHDSQQSTELKCLMTENIDIVFALIIRENKKFVVGAAYVPPDDQASLDLLLKSLTFCVAFCNEHNINNLIFMGDFNCRHEAWNDTTRNQNGQLLHEYIESAEHLTLANPNTPTFSCINGSSIIDLCITSPNLLPSLSNIMTDNTIEHFTGAPNRGHFPVTWEWLVPNSAKKQVKWDLTTINWEYWCQKLDEMSLTTLQDISILDDTFQIWHSIEDLLKQCMIDVIDTKVITRHSKPYWNERLSSLSKDLRQVKKKLKQRENDSHWAQYMRHKELFKLDINRSLNTWLQDNLTNLNKTSGPHFWKKYQRFIADRNKISLGALKNHEGKLVSSTEERIEVLKRSFFTGEHLNSQNFSEIDRLQAVITKTRLLSKDALDEKSCFLNEPISLHEIERALKNLKTVCKAFDLDGFHPKLIKHSGPRFRLILQYLFSKSLECEKWVWREGKVIFLPKNGKKDYLEAKSFRPIALLSLIGKLFESIIAARINWILTINNALDDNQEGFRSGRGTSRMLYKIFSDINGVNYQKRRAVLVGIDLEKAFDSVDVNLMTIKLINAGVVGKLARLIHDYLSSRAIRIQIDDTVSPQFSCELGLPQGSILSPLLFIIFIIDIVSDPTLTHYKYADDTTLLVELNTASDSLRKASEAIEQVTNWCFRNRIMINVSKTVFLPINFSKEELDQAQSFTHNGTKVVKERLTVTGIEIGAVNETIMTASRNDWAEWAKHKQFCQITNGLNCKTIIKLYRCVIQPKVFYGLPAWNTENLSKISDLQNTVLHTATGGYSKPAVRNLELMTGVKPVDIQVQILTIKFLSKVLSTNDYMKKYILENADTNPKVIRDLKMLKCFLAWKFNSRTNRNIDINDLTAYSLTYNQAEIEKYELGLWQRHWTHQCEGKWSFRLMPFRLKSFRLTCLVTSPNFFRRNVFYFGHFA